MTAEHLERDDQNRIADERFETALLEGLDSGEPIEIDDEWWSRKATELTARVNRNGKSRRDGIE
jgi:antitoxin ParD1/3/4